ncbi:MAG TPA: MucR family transcriptional regulator [Sphingomonadales bacterium]|jgi:predicted transcriptional regulator
MPENNTNPVEILELTADIVASYVSNNVVPVSELSNVIGQVYASLSGLGKAPAQPEAKLEPAVPIRRSVTPDYIICLEDGKKLKMLKRHLKTRYGLTPEEYRERWGLPADYPMVAPNYAIQRRDLAKKIGLGRSRRSTKRK